MSAQPAGEPMMFRARRAAALLDTSVETLRYWTRKGRIRPTRIGRAVYYTRAELLRFVEAAAAESNPQTREGRPGQAAPQENRDNAPTSVPR